MTRHCHDCNRTGTPQWREGPDGKLHCFRMVSNGFSQTCQTAQIPLTTPTAVATSCRRAHAHMNLCTQSTFMVTQDPRRCATRAVSSDSACAGVHDQQLQQRSSTHHVFPANAWHAAPRCERVFVVLAPRLHMMVMLNARNLLFWSARACTIAL